ncbi:SGNH/GDSL hydrolase family protein [Sphingobacteriales bacterium CHB3]|nr:SGNH/GDSL hydrolase family protein [Sphingobacteriales bacterium CHB3]
MKPGSAAQSFIGRSLRLFGLLLFGTLAGVLLLEAIVRIIEPHATGVYVAFNDDMILNHVIPPNVQGRLIRTDFDTDFNTNSLGLRDREFTVSKPPNTFRILMLGDSFTVGEGVNHAETFSKLLEAALNANAPSERRIEVINAGVGSYSPLLEFLYLRHNGLQLQPDLVVLNFDISDLYDDIQYSQTVRLDGDGVPVAAPFDPTLNRSIKADSFLSRLMLEVKDFLKDHIRLYNFVRFRVYLRNEQRKREGSRSGDLRFDKLAQLRSHYINRGDEDWALSLEYISLIRDTLQHRNIDFWITLYPYGIQVNGWEWREGRKFWDFEADSVYSMWPQEHMEKFCNKAGIKVINMCEDFKNASVPERPLYHTFDGHWTSAGHELATAKLRSHLEPYLKEELLH